MTSDDSARVYSFIKWSRNNPVKTLQLQAHICIHPCRISRRLNLEFIICNWKTPSVPDLRHKSCLKDLWIKGSAVISSKLSRQLCIVTAIVRYCWPSIYEDCRPFLSIIHSPFGGFLGTTWLQTLLLWTVCILVVRKGFWPEVACSWNIAHLSLLWFIIVYFCHDRDIDPPGDWTQNVPHTEVAAILRLNLDRFNSPHDWNHLITQVLIVLLGFSH